MAAGAARAEHAGLSLRKGRGYERPVLDKTLTICPVCGFASGQRLLSPRFDTHVFFGFRRRKKWRREYGWLLGGAILISVARMQNLLFHNRIHDLGKIPPAARHSLIRNFESGTDQLFCQCLKADLSA